MSLFLVLLEASAVFVALFLLGLLVYARWNYGILESLNIPVVNRTLFLGSTPDLHKTVQHFQDIQRYKTYGPIFGVYEGRKPIVYICDPEIIKLVFVKDFESFQDRREIDLGHPLVNEMLDFLQFERWREIRGAMSPAFTSGKMKTMSIEMAKSIQELCHYLDKECTKGNGSFKTDIRERMDGLFMDLICRSAFGITIGEAQDPNNKFIKLFRDLMGQDGEFGLLYTLSLVFPFLTRLAPTLESDTATKIAATMQSVMSARRKSGQTRNDFVDILNSMMDKISTSTEYKRLKITETTVMAQGINFVLAGYDAKCTTVTMLLYNLAKYEEIQNIVLNEIDSFVESNDGEIPYEKIGELPHLQACLQETLRLYPPFIRPERICTKDWEHDGIRIKKGLLVMAPAWAVNRNPQIYPNPDNFDPTRFLPENKASLNTYAFSTFGAGPRGCIGVRYAMDAMKFSLCHILKNYRFRLCSDTKINYKTGVLFLVMYDSVNLEIVRRTP